MTNESKAIEIIVNKIINAVNEKFKKQSYDKTFPSVVYGKDENGKYQIPYESRLRSIPNAIPCELQKGQLVWVKIPNGKLREMHICGLRYK